MRNKALKTSNWRTKMFEILQDAETKKARPLAGSGFVVWRGGDLLSRANAHYHRRKPVSRSCSGWEGVVPGCYSRHMDGMPQRMIGAANRVEETRLIGTWFTFPTG
jgi:hypothetical protein